MPKFASPLRLFVLAWVMVALVVPSSLLQPQQMTRASSLPAKASHQAKTIETGLFRTRVTVRDSYARQRLDKLGVVVLEQGDDWAVVLVEAQQLEDLARLGFRPQSTDDLGTLVAAHAEDVPELAASLQPVLDRAAQTYAMRDAGVASLASVEADLSAELKAIAEVQQAAVAGLLAVDDDGDGLTNTQEEWWCTDSLDVDSDGDGVSDGDEVAALKAWMRNETASYPVSGKPFLGWPPDHVECWDDDKDSVPDMAEQWELGLNRYRESTDRDKFDDGQELFGLTHCTGEGGYCSYGALPRDADWGVVLAEMPAWVAVPVNHPFVAAFPMVQVDIEHSSFHVETITVVTTDHVITEGEERTYSTAKTQGTSTSVSNSQMWNEWQEITESAPSMSLISDNSLVAANSSSVYQLLGDSIHTGYEALDSLCMAIDSSGLSVPYEEYVQLGCLALNSPQIGMNLVEIGKSWGDFLVFNGTSIGLKLRSQFDIAQHKVDQFQEQLRTNRYSRIVGHRLNVADTLWQASCGSDGNCDPVKGYYGNLLSVQDGLLASQSSYQTQFPLLLAQTKTTRGHLNGGARTNTHTSYEEHTATNGEAFSTEEAWGMATAMDSAHAADLWFSYQVRNSGTEYAREICDLAFNLYIGDDPNPAYTYFVAGDVGGDGCFHTFMPGESHLYTSRRIPLSLEQMKAIDLGGPLRIEVEDFTYGIDELFYADAAGANVLLALEDGTADGDESIDRYLIPSWGTETVLDVLARYFPHSVDEDGDLTAIWTPEYRGDTPAWCDQPRRTEGTLWCRHALSTADWWNVYTNGMGDGTQGFQDTPATPGATALFRFNKDSDLDGYSDRSEVRLGTDPQDAASYPHPELLAGVHSFQSGTYVTATLSLLNTGLYDAYGVEAVMLAPDDSVSIVNNTVGGSGRVRAQQDVVVGSRIMPPSYSAASWGGTAQPFSAGYYTGQQDRVYTFTALHTGDVGVETRQLSWSDGLGTSGTLDVGTGYASPTPLNIGGFGVQVGLISGDLRAGDVFTVAARTPRDTFQYVINREPHTEPVVVVSYNDPQGNHRFLVPPSAMSLSTPTQDLVPFAGQMLQDPGVEIVSTDTYTVGTDTVNLVVNNPTEVTLTGAHLFLEFVNITGTVASEVPVTVTLPAGPTVVPVTWNTAVFSPTFRADEDYIVMAFWTDYEGNILDTAARPLSSFWEDPTPKLAMAEEELVWDFGAVPQGTVLKHTFAVANTGLGDLLTYVSAPEGVTLSQTGSRSVGTADVAEYEIVLKTSQLPLGSYSNIVTLRSSDTDRSTQTITVIGELVPDVPDTPVGDLLRPLDWSVSLASGTQGQWVEYTHTLGPDMQTLHPVRVFSEDYETMWGVGRYASALGEGAAYSLFGDGSKGDLTVYPTQAIYPSTVRAALHGIASAGQLHVPLESASGFNVGDEVLIMQMLGTSAGMYETGKVSGIDGNTLILSQALINTYDGFVPLVTLCDGTNYTGYCETFRTHHVDLNYSLIGNDTASSIAVSPGSMVTLFADGYYGSDYSSFSSSDPDLSNDAVGANRASSLRITSSHLNRAQVLSVPNYRNVTIQNGGFLRAHPWNGLTGGVMAMRVSGMLQIDGHIDLGGSGYRRGHLGHFSYVPARAQGWQGESYLRDGITSRDPNSGGGGGGQGDDKTRNMGAGGGGGGYATSGATGQPAGSPVAYGGIGGSVYGTNNLTNRIHFGSAGGGGGSDDGATSPGGYGGAGGGIAIVSARQIEISGVVTADGADGGTGHNGRIGGGGGGAGGSILMQAGSLTSNSGQVQTLGGQGGAGLNSGGAGGAGGAGRIHIQYCEPPAGLGSTNPAAYLQELDCHIVEQVESAPYNLGYLDLPESFTDGRLYWVQYGRRHLFSTASSWDTVLRVPANALDEATMDVLISEVIAGDLTLRLDVGADGNWDWETTENVDKSVVLSTADLAAAFNSYWVSQGAPISGDLDVPVRVYLSKAGQVLLTNLQITPTGSRLRYVQLPSENYDEVMLDLGIGDDVLFADDFSTHNPDRWSEETGTWQVTDGVFDAVGAGGAIDAWAYAGDETWTDYSFRTRVNMISGNGEVVFRSTGHWQNEYRLTLWSGNSSSYPNNLGLKRYQDGEVTSISSQVLPIDVPDVVEVRVDVQGDHIDVYLDGVKWIDLDDPDGPAAGRVGLGVIWNWHAQFDDVLVLSLNDANIRSSMSAPLAYSVGVDVGDDGTVDWANSGSGLCPVSLTTSDVATSVNTYLTDQTGEVDVPVRLYVTPYVNAEIQGFSAVPSASADVTLIATDVQFGFTNPTEGVTVPVTATVHNEGPGNSDPLTAAFFATLPAWGEWYIGSALVPDVPAGGTAQAAIQWNTLGFTGTVPVRVELDPYDRLAETNEGNNEASTTYHILTRPDLYASDIVFSDQEPMAGETVTATLMLQNGGETSVLRTSVGFEVDDTLAGQKNVVALGGESETPVPFAWTPTQPGPYRLRWTSDRADVVDEYNETNNVAWRDVYVGHPSPLLLDSGVVANDPAYTTTTGYGVVDLGQPDVLSVCGSGAAPHETLRRDPSGEVVYQFDHLLPGHFYHLDVILYECDGAGRQESIYVDGMLVAGPEDLGDGEVHQLSVRLDPALHADHRINVSIKVPGIDGAVVSEVNLYDIDYRYADAGGSIDPKYPAQVDLAYGWLDGTDSTAWGQLPYQSVRVDQDSTDGDELRYQFDGLDLDKRYNIHFTFWESSDDSTAHIQRVRIDGLDTGLTVDTGDYQMHHETVAVPAGAYSEDGTVVVSIVRLNAASGAMVNEIALEEETRKPVSVCQVAETPHYTNVYGSVWVLDQPAPVGTVVKAYNPRGDVVGCYVVTTPGDYGFIRVYGEDATAVPPIPGMRDGEIVEFRVGGSLATATPMLTWQNDHGQHAVDLNAGVIDGQLIDLETGWNLISFYEVPPVPSVPRVLNYIDGLYDRVLSENKVYVPSLPDYSTLTELDAGEGYYLRLSSATSVDAYIEGISLTVTTPLSLHFGWNWVGYLPRVTLPVTEALQSIDGHYRWVHSVNQTYDVALPDYSDLRFLEPGKGYLIYVTEPVTLVYPDAGAVATGGVKPQEAMAGCEGMMPTPRLSLVYGTVTVNSAPAPTGARVQVVTPRGEVAGCAVVGQDGLLPLTHVYGADIEAIPPIPGFRAGESLAFLVNGLNAEVGTTPLWQADRLPHKITLAARVQNVYLPMVSRTQ